MALLSWPRVVPPGAQSVACSGAWFQLCPQKWPWPGHRVSPAPGCFERISLCPLTHMPWAPAWQVRAPVQGAQRGLRRRPMVGAQVGLRRLKLGGLTSHRVLTGKQSWVVTCTGWRAEKFTHVMYRRTKITAALETIKWKHNEPIPLQHWKKKKLSILNSISSEHIFQKQCWSRLFQTHKRKN